MNQRHPFDIFWLWWTMLHMGRWSWNHWMKPGDENISDGLGMAFVCGFPILELLAGGIVHCCDPESTSWFHMYIYIILLYIERIYDYIYIEYIQFNYFRKHHVGLVKYLGWKHQSDMELLEHVVPVMKSRALWANLEHPKQGQQGEGANIIQPDFNGLGVPWWISWVVFDGI